MATLPLMIFNYFHQLGHTHTHMQVPTLHLLTRNSFVCLFIFPSLQDMVKNRKKEKYFLFFFSSRFCTYKNNGNLQRALIYIYMCRMWCRMHFCMSQVFLHVCHLHSVCVCVCVCACICRCVCARAHAYNVHQGMCVCISQCASVHVCVSSVCMCVACMIGHMTCLHKACRTVIISFYW